MQKKLHQLAGHLLPSGWILDAVLLVILGYFISEQFDLSLLLKDTILTGGDSASWYQTALHLKQELIPHGRLFGWDQSNFFGYPNFQYYFIPPFLLAVLLSYVIPLTISLKIVTIIGLFGTPYAVYWALLRMRYKRPVPVAGAWLSLIFLFHERFNMFGGNALSTFAGEFAYSFSFLLLILFMGALHHGIRNKNRLILNSALLAILGLSHAFVFLTAVFMPTYFLWTHSGCKETVVYIIKLYFMAFLFMAFWVLPMLWQLDYTTPIRMIWNFNSLNDLFYSLHYEVLLAALLPCVLLAAMGLKSRYRSFYLYMIALSAILYFCASLLKIPDIRFFPPILFFSLLLIADNFSAALGPITRYPGLASTALLALAILTGGSWLFDDKLQAPGWFRWNYSGYEYKPAFRDGTMQQLTSLLKANSGIPAPRVAWEKTAPYNNDFGSDRVFENLPLFTGRSSTEGIHYSSALLSKPITWLHGEHSLSSASPEAIIYPHYNFSVIPARFRMFNISELITRTPQVKELVTQSGDFHKLGDAGKLSVFRLKGGSGGYISTPAFAPVLANLDSSTWKERYYAWFQHPDNLDHPIVSKHFVLTTEDAQHFPNQEIHIDQRGKLKQPILRPVTAAKISMLELNDQTISFNTDSPGQPHIIKVSYSPNWCSETGETIFPVAPGLMLLYPIDKQVKLSYSRHWVEIVGGVLTLCGLLLALFWRKFNNLQLKTALQPLTRLICRYRVFISSFGVMLFVIAATFSYQIKQQIKGDYQLGLKLNSDGDKSGAERAFKLASSEQRMQQYPQNSEIPHALTALAWLYVSQNKDDEAMGAYEKIIAFSPHWIFIHRTYLGIGQLHERAGNFKKAAESFQQCADIDQYDSTGKECGDKVDEMLARLLQEEEK